MNQDKICIPIKDTPDSITLPYRLEGLEPVDSYESEYSPTGKFYVYPWAWIGILHVNYEQEQYNFVNSR